MNFVDRMSNVMSFSVRKRDAISNNIANQSTPNYKSEVVTFKDIMDKTNSLYTTKQNHISSNNEGNNFEVSREYSTEVNSDGNNVDTNKEIVELMKNNQIFSMSVAAVNNYYAASSAARGKY